MQVVQESLRSAFKSTPVSGLSALDRLPQELVSIVLLNLDLLSYFRFRQVNRRARILSSALREYELVAKHGLEGLSGFLRTKLGHCFTIMELYLLLIAPNCTLCGEFGGFLFLLTATRCCFACIRQSPKLRVLCASSFGKIAQISTRRLCRLLELTLCTIPGFYSMDQRSARRPKYLIPEDQTIAALTLLGVISQRHIQALVGRNEQVNQRFMASTAFPWYSLDSAEIEHGVSCKGCQVRVEASDGSYEDRDHVYSKAGFLTHFKRCREAQHLWTESKNGTRLVDEPEFTRRCGYFNKFGLDGRPS